MESCLLQLLAQAVPLPVEDGELFLLLRRLGGQLPPLLLSRFQVLLQLLLPLGVLRRHLLQIVQHILPVKAAGWSMGHLVSAPLRGILSVFELLYHTLGGNTILLHGRGKQGLRGEDACAKVGEKTAAGQHTGREALRWHPAFIRRSIR